MFERYWDRDTWLVQQKTKIVLGVFAVFFISLFMSCQEFHYWTSGKVTDARASTRVDREVRRGETYPQRVLGYSYDDGGTPRSKYVNVPMDWPLQDQSTIKIQYIPGGDTSRPLGQHNTIWVCIFFGSLAAAVGGCYILVKTV